jgi:hypothetical protein
MLLYKLEHLSPFGSCMLSVYFTHLIQDAETTQVTLKHMILSVQLHFVSSSLLLFAESQGIREDGEKKRMYSVSSRCYARTIYAAQLQSYGHYDCHDRAVLRPRASIEGLLWQLLLTDVATRSSIIVKLKRGVKVYRHHFAAFTD